MPTYRYECANAECATGGEFTVFQSMSAEALKLCPTCGKVVERLIGPAYVSTPKGNTDLKSMGFAKLVKRDKGVYENVTALDNESRYWHADKPETMPDIKRRVKD